MSTGCKSFQGPWMDHCLAPVWKSVPYPSDFGQTHFLFRRPGLESFASLCILIQHRESKSVLDPRKLMLLLRQLLGFHLPGLFHGFLLPFLSSDSFFSISSHILSLCAFAAASLAFTSSTIFC